MEESKIIAIMEKYIEAAKQRKKVDGFLCSMLFLFYKDTNEVNDLYGYRVEPVGFNVTSMEVKDEMQRVANMKAKDKGLLAVGMLEEVYYKPDADNSDASLSLDPDSLNAIYVCAYFSNGSTMAQKTIFYKDFGLVDKPVEDPEFEETHNIVYVDQMWNSSQNPTEPMLLNPFE